MKNCVEMPLVSIIVPVYNVEDYLEQCISSILEQTYKNIEVILIDDGSGDRCPDICDEFAQEDCRIHVVHKKNAGVVSARCTGLRIAKGEYIQFVDGDDWIAKDMVHSLLFCMLEENVDLVICNYYFCVFN